MAPIIQHIQDLYKELYVIGNKISKRDKLGLHQNIEEACRGILILSIKASLSPGSRKLPMVEDLRVGVETLKYLVRISHELSIISQRQYISIEKPLQEISKEANGWLRYITKQSSHRGLL